MLNWASESERASWPCGGARAKPCTHRSATDTSKLPRDPNTQLRNHARIRLARGPLPCINNAIGTAALRFLFRTAVAQAVVESAKSLSSAAVR